METNIIDITPQTKKVIKETEVMVKNYQDYTIALPEQYTGAAEHLKLIKAKYKELEDTRKSMTGPIDEAKRNIMDLFRAPLSALENAENIIKRAMLSWQQVQEQKRRAEEARLAEIQRKETEKLAERARKAEEAGKTEKAEELRQQVLEKETFVPTIAPTVEKVAGISTKTIWKFEIINKDIIPRDYLTPDLEKIGQVARATKGTLTILGVRIYSEETIAAGR